MNSETLSFATLEKRIQAMPDGPSSVLTTPRWLVWFDVIGTAGMIIGILPFLMIQILTPRLWMVGMAHLGLCLTIAYVPHVVHSVWVMVGEFWRWRPKLVEQSDHDLAQFRELRSWLRKFPRAALEDHRRFAHLSQERLAAKLGLLQGGFDKLGVLPALLALLLLVVNAGNLSIDTLLRVPVWQSGLALIFIITYFIAFLAMRMRLRLQLYEAVLDDALELKGTEAINPRKAG